MGYSKRLYRELLNETRGHCYYCGEYIEGIKFEIEHIIPRANGGSGTKRNLTVSCKKCNRTKSDKTLKEFRKQFKEKEFEKKTYFFERIRLFKGESYV